MSAFFLSLVFLCAANVHAEYSLRVVDIQAPDLISIEFSPDLQQLARMDATKIEVYSLEDGSILRSFDVVSVIGDGQQPDNYKVGKVLFSADSKTLISLHLSGHLVVWDLLTGNPVTQVKVNPGVNNGGWWNSEIHVSPDSRWLGIGSFPNKQLSILSLKEPNSRLISVTTAFSSDTFSISQDSQFLYYSSGDGAYEFALGPQTSRLLFSEPRNESTFTFRVIDVSSDGSYLLTCGQIGSSREGYLDIWERKTGARIASLPPSEERKFVLGGHWNSQNHLVYVAGFGLVWDWKKSRIYQAPAAHLDPFGYYSDYIFSGVNSDLLVRFSDGNRPAGYIFGIWNFISGDVTVLNGEKLISTPHPVGFNKDFSKVALKAWMSDTWKPVVTMYERK